MPLQGKNCFPCRWKNSGGINIAWMIHRSIVNQLLAFIVAIGVDRLIQLLPIPDPISVRLTGQGPGRTARVLCLCESIWPFPVRSHVNFPGFCSNLHGLIPMCYWAMGTLVGHLLSPPAPVVPSQTANCRVLLPAKCMIVNNWYCFGHY